jgi:hypothetical protein
LKAIEANLDRMSHQMTLADWSAGSVSNHRQRDIVASIECETSEGSKFTTSKRLIPLTAKLAFWPNILRDG